MAIAAASRAYSFSNGRLVLSGEIVPVLYYADTDEVWMRAKQIHTFTGATTMAQTLQRVDSEDKSSLKELIRRKGMPPMVGVLNTPTPNPEEYHEGKAIYVNEPGFYTIVLGSKKAECKAFKRWVTHEVLPQIRRTGQYNARDAQAVVVSPDGPAADQLARLLTTVETRLTAQDEILARVQERLDRDCQRINLNVRAPKRSSPHDPPIATGALPGRPLPVAKFLDQKQRVDPSLADVRRSFAPTFGMVLTVLKKRKLKDDGGRAVYVQQNHRPQERIFLHVSSRLDIPPVDGHAGRKQLPSYTTPRRIAP